MWVERFGDAHPAGGRGLNERDRPALGSAPVLMRANRVGYCYPNGTEALRDVSLAIEQGRNVALIGPSGCGKSTLLQIAAGLCTPSSGSIQWDHSTSGADHPLSMMFQKDTLLPWLTVSKNVGLFFRLRGQKSGGYKGVVDDLLKIGGLAEAADQFPYQLSGGMRRRAQFLASVAPSPGIILLDEPFSSLDEPTRIALHQDVFEISRRRQMSMLLVTHDLAEAISLSDEIVVLTRRPATVASRHIVPFGSERDLHALREDSDFLKLYGTIWHELNKQIQLSNLGADAHAELKGATPK
jgi:NitT/TauT family transport system ATP-binding protein